MVSQTIVSAAKLHYIYDPLCGWCYGAAPLIQAAREIMAVQAHAGGMLTGARRMTVAPELRQFVMSHDQRIAQLTGQPFGTAYTDGLLRADGTVFDSAPPITAILAAEQIGRRGLDLLARLQSAHYVEGRRIAEPAVLRGLAAEIGLDVDAFAQAYAELDGAATRAHIEASRALLARLGAGGFPTLALEHGGSLTVLDITPYHGNVAAWRALLGRQVVASVEASNEGLNCGLQGCLP
jgi:putative protein-disulfide isomerase